MKKLLTTLKTFSIALSISSCQTFPDLHPDVLKAETHEIIPCKIIDKEKFIFKCHAELVRPLDARDNGKICLPGQEVADIISWAKDHQNQCIANPK